jgi:hypothetical protein
MWILFRAEAPTSDGQSARAMYEKRLTWITGEMQHSAASHGCRFHRAWYAEDGSAFYALACWDSREGARRFFEEWEIESEPGETATVLVGDVGLIPLG